MKLIIIGTSTTAKTIFSFISKYNLYEVLGFAVNKKYIKESTFCNLPIYAIEDLKPDAEYSIFIAIQWNRLNADRKDLYAKLKSKGFKFANIISPNAIINGEIEGENCWIADMAVVDFGTKIKNNVFVKVGAMIGPNVYINDHCFIGAKSTIGGATKIGMQSFVGLNATIFDTVEIGEKCIIGACSIIKRNIPNYTKCTSSLENLMIKTYDEEIIEEKLLFSKNIR